MPLEEGVRRLTGLPAENWKLRDRGCLKPGCFADIVIFDPATIADHATYDKPQQIRDRRARRFRQRRAGPARRRAHRRKARAVVRGPGWKQ